MIGEDWARNCGYEPVEAATIQALGYERTALKYELEGRSAGAHSSWYRGSDCNFNPRAENLISADSVMRYVVGSWAPDEPLIGPDTQICAFGSCFAANISKWLASRNFNVLTNHEVSNSSYVVRFGEGLVNSYSLLQQFEWAFENRKDDIPLWHDNDAHEHGYDEEVRLQTLELFSRTDVFILTLGLSEVWYDEATGGVFWRAIPADKFDPKRHRFRVTSVAENRINLTRIYELIRRYRPTAKIIFTMSPIPLVATFRSVPCITANSASKAILRAALDEFLRSVGDEARVYYWPSYEIVLDVFADPWCSNRRHVREEILEFIMTLFEHVWCFGSTPRFTLSETWIRARAAAGQLPRRVPKLFDTRSASKLADAVASLRRIGRIGDAELILQRAAEIGLEIPEPLPAGEAVEPPSTSASAGTRPDQGPASRADPDTLARSCEMFIGDRSNEPSPSVPDRAADMGAVDIVPQQ